MKINSLNKELCHYQITMKHKLNVNYLLRKSTKSMKERENSGRYISHSSFDVNFTILKLEFFFRALKNCNVLGLRFGIQICF